MSQWKRTKGAREEDEEVEEEGVGQYFPRRPSPLDVLMHVENNLAANLLHSFSFLPLTAPCALSPYYFYSSFLSLSLFFGHPRRRVPLYPVFGLHNSTLPHFLIPFFFSPQTDELFSHLFLSPTLILSLSLSFSVFLALLLCSRAHKQFRHLFWQTHNSCHTPRTTVNVSWMRYTCSFTIFSFPILSFSLSSTSSSRGVFFPLKLPRSLFNLRETQTKRRHPPRT